MNKTKITRKEKVKMSGKNTNSQKKRKRNEKTDKVDNVVTKKVKKVDFNDKYSVINETQATLFCFDENLKVTVNSTTKKGKSTHQLICHVNNKEVPLNGPIGVNLLLKWVGKVDDGNNYFHIKGILTIISSLIDGGFTDIGMELKEEYETHLLKEGFTKSTILKEFNMHRLFLALHKADLSKSCAFKYDEERYTIKCRTNWKQDEDKQALPGIFKDDFNCKKMVDGKATDLTFGEKGLNVSFSGSYAFVVFNPWTYLNTRGFNKKGDLSTIFFMSDMLVIYEENKIEAKTKDVIDINQMFSEEEYILVDTV